MVSFKRTKCAWDFPIIHIDSNLSVIDVPLSTCTRESYLVEIMRLAVAGVCRV